jgi:hypothetical protein
MGIVSPVGAIEGLKQNRGVSNFIVVGDNELLQTSRGQP